MPENGTNGERRAISGIALKWIHVVIFIGANVVSVAGLYATMRAQVDELREQQKGTITQGQFQEFKEDIERRLDRMENTLDRFALKKEIQDLH